MRNELIDEILNYASDEFGSTENLISLSKMSDEELIKTLAGILEPFNRTYVLYGSDVVGSFESGNIEEAKSLLEEGDGDLAVYDDQTSIVDVIVESNGWNDYSILTTKDYLQLKMGL